MNIRSKMMQTISVAEATTHINTLLNQIEAGVEIMITRWGQPIARIIPVKKTLKPIPFEELAAFRATQPKSPTSSLEHLQALRDEARY
jgi:prevent-host-death family protein